MMEVSAVHLALLSVRTVSAIYQQLSVYIVMKDTEERIAPKVILLEYVLKSISRCLLHIAMLS